MSHNGDDRVSNITTKVYRYGGKTKVRVEFEVAEDKYFDKDEIVARLKVTTPWLLEHLIGWADFDHYFTIQLWIDSLERLGDGLIRWDNALHARRNGRRAKFAAHLLKRAYNWETYNDKSYENWINRHSNIFKSAGKGYTRLMHDYHYDNAMGMDRREYSNKMWKIITNRSDKCEQQAIDDAWAYIKKYLPMWWD